MDAVIQFKNVSKKYRVGATRASLPALISNWSRSVISRSKAEDPKDKWHWALQDINFELSKSQSLALVGANGAGKTTTLKLLAHITQPTSGSIMVNGKLSALIELGAGFHPDLTGRENVYLNGAIMGLKRSEIKRRFDGIVEFSGLSKFIDTPLKRYSSGMAVRLGFAIASSVDPEILLVDEVLAVGDVSFQLSCMTRIQELLDNGTTLVFVSHNMGLIKAVCQMGMYIENGQAKYFGTSGGAVDAYNKAMNELRVQKFERSGEVPKGQSASANITKVEARCLEGGEIRPLMTHSPVEISIQYYAHQDLGDAAVVLQIIRSDGICCAKLYSRLDNAEIKLKKGHGEITAELDPIQLVPGRYSVVATLKNKKESYTHDMVYSEWFMIEGDTTGDDDLEAIYMPNHIWHHKTYADGEAPMIQSDFQKSLSSPDFM